MKIPMNPDAELNQQAEELVALLDALAESGSQHIHLNVGEETKIQTVNSTECNPQLGACAIPNFNGEAPDDDEEF
jgi:pyruvate-formate lyase